MTQRTRHRHGSGTQFQDAPQVDVAIDDLLLRVIALEGHNHDDEYSKLSHKHTTPPPPPTTGEVLAFDGLDPANKGLWSNLYYGGAAGDPGDRLDTDMLDKNLAPFSPGHMASFDASGNLIITTKRQATPSGRPFASATIWTKGKFAQKYGRFEADLWYDNGQGFWPAFWTLPSSWPTPTLPEMDILEAFPGNSQVGGPNYAGQVLHVASGGPYVGRQYLYTVNGSPVIWNPDATPSPPPGAIAVDLTKGYHRHEVLWTPTKFQYSIDGIKTQLFPSVPASAIPQPAAVVIINGGVGAPGYRADASTPDVMLARFRMIKVWKYDSAIHGA